MPGARSVALSFVVAAVRARPVGTAATIVPDADVTAASATPSPWDFDSSDIANNTCKIIGKQSSCPWDLTPVGCTFPPLSVVYPTVEHYSSAVNCGNLFFDVDLGSSEDDPAPFAPTVTYKGAEPKALYTFIMYDPDADMGCSFPNCDVGSLAPIRHWVVGNIAGSDLALGDFSKADVVTPFASPGPPIGSHRYSMAIYKQKRKLDFETLTNGATNDGVQGRYNWDLMQFMGNYSLVGAPVASNWQVVTASPVGYANGP